MAVQKERQMIFTTKKVEEMTDKLNDGVVLKRFENPWMKSEIGIRRAGVSFAMTVEEQQEYIRCAVDIHYFTEKYCKVKTEDGSINNIKLREYQKEIMDNFVNNRFNILLASRQVGKCNSLITNVLCEIISNNGLIKEINIPMYKLLFMYKNDKDIYDYVKYGIYTIIDFLS